MTTLSISILIVYVLYVLCTGGLCEDGWYGHPLYPHCYKTSPQRLSYDKAKATCEGEESILVTPSDYMQKMAFQQALSPHQTGNI